MKKEEFFEKLGELLLKYCVKNKEYENISEDVTISVKNTKKVKEDVRVVFSTTLIRKEFKVTKK